MRTETDTRGAVSVSFTYLTLSHARAVGIVWEQSHETTRQKDCGESRNELYMRKMFKDDDYGKFSQAGECVLHVISLS